MNKNLLKLTLVFFIGAVMVTSAFAQNGQIKLDNPKHKHLGEIEKPIDNSANKQQYDNWKYPVDAAITIGTSINRYVSFLFQDSIVKWVPDPAQGGTDYFYPWHSVGAAFDPTDVNLEVVDDGIRLSRFNPYKVDSIFMPYLYVRYVDSFDFGSGNEEVVDTLIVQFFNYQDLEFRSFTGGSLNEVFAKADNWNRNKLGNGTEQYIVKIPLTSSDSTLPPTTGWLTRGITIPIPDILIPDDPTMLGTDRKYVCGFQMTYKTALPFSYGDTMEARNGAIPAKRLNYFGHNLYLNEGTDVPQTETYNNSFWVNSEILYGKASNGWQNNIPGNAYFDDRYLYYAIHIDTDKLGVDDIDNNITFAVYPNPVSKSQTLKLDFALENSENVDIAIYDILGNQVKAVASGFYAAGEHKIDLNISDLTAGVYLYSIKAGNGQTTKKITITE